MKYIFFFILFSVFNITVFSDPIQVNVGAYNFCPYLKMSKEIIKIFNSIQHEFIFNFVYISPKRRYEYMKDKKIDIIFFEDKKWGWQHENVKASDIILNDGEVYITYNDGIKDQQYFNDLSDKKILGVLGYHYGFADFNADETYLRDHFNVEFSICPRSLIRKILSERGDIAVVTISALRGFLSEHPEHRKNILISEKKDQVYEISVIVGEHSPISMNSIDKIFKMIKDNGQFQRFLEKHNIHDLMEKQ